MEKVMNSNVQEIRKKRFLFLRRLYEMSEGDQDHDVSMDDVGTEFGYSPQETYRIAQYLNGEGLIEHVTLSGDIAITHYGVVQVEDALTNPEQPSQYFPAVNNIININHMTGSQIQQGTSQSTQMITVSNIDSETISTFINEFNNKLPELQLDVENQKEAEADISTVEAQLKSPKPKHSIISECLKSLRSILENAAGQAMATLLLSQIPRF
jgi:hypothetical protein